MRPMLALVIATIVALAACAPAQPAPSAQQPASKPAEAAKPAEPAKPAAAAPSLAAAPAAPAAPAASSAGNPIVLNMALVPNLNYTSVYVGVEKGIFLKHGIDVKAHFNSSGPQATKAVEAGDAEVGAANFATHVAARAAGSRLVGFWLYQNDPFTVNDDDTAAIIVPPNSPIQSVADLAGKKIGRASAGAYDPYTRLHLTAAGVDPKTVEMINVEHANMPGALKGGGLDAAVFSEPYAQIYLLDNPGARILVRGGGKVAFKVLATAREDWLQKNRDLAAQLSLALAEAEQYVRQHQDEAALISTRWLPGLPLEAAKRALPYYSQDPRISSQVRASWEQENKTLIEQKRIKEAIPLADGFDTSFAESFPQKYPGLYSDLKPLP
ncbi:MAG: NrtA/SsuA/CpmA family ABC transporter substrate-binding protein [Chloroflexi bacterium]|nr:NrtA/SsuA/CpmA family ABC transporter substrate-binding protein [Chloroflexota bacterium]